MNGFPVGQDRCQRLRRLTAGLCVDGLRLQFFDLKIDTMSPCNLAEAFLGIMQ